MFLPFRSGSTMRCLLREVCSEVHLVSNSHQVGSRGQWPAMSWSLFGFHPQNWFKLDYIMLQASKLTKNWNYVAIIRVCLKEFRVGNFEIFDHIGVEVLIPFWSKFWCEGFEKVLGARFSVLERFSESDCKIWAGFSELDFSKIWCKNHQIWITKQFWSSKIVIFLHRICDFH